ncbi:MAG: hypothetical protein HQK96_16960 [Nitrospirae bacterium]|nr:hypothetical protein [Nitrospirota bacterium]
MAERGKITPPQKRETPKKEEIGPSKKPEKERRIEPPEPWPRTGKKTNS